MPALRIPRLLSSRGGHILSRRFSVAAVSRSAWSPMPSPPRLPKEDQEMFEKLQQQSTGAFSTPRGDPATEVETPSPEVESESSSPRRTPMQVNQSPHSEQTTEGTLKARFRADGDGEELHPNVRRGAAPEFQGDRNPKTGEVGGPKNEPLRWGHASDWSYNGRVTDF